MSRPLHDGLINKSVSDDVRNALILAGFNPAEVGEDRPLPPDGLKIMADLWNNGASVDLIMSELKLSEARASADLLFLELKGEITGFVNEIVCGGANNVTRRGN